MDAAELYHFLFETMPGIGILVGCGIVISIIVCAVSEVKTRKRFRNHDSEEDEWTLYEDEGDDSGKDA